MATSVSPTDMVCRDHRLDFKSASSVDPRASDNAMSPAVLGLAVDLLELQRALFGWFAEQTLQRGLPDGDRLAPRRVCLFFLPRPDTVILVDDLKDPTRLGGGGSSNFQAENCFRIAHVETNTPPASDRLVVRFRHLLPSAAPVGPKKMAGITRPPINSVWLLCPRTGSRGCTLAGSCPLGRRTPGCRR